TGAKRIDLWVPVPHDDAYQQIKNLRIESPYAYRIAPASHGNTMLHVRIGEPKESTFPITMSLDATRTEHILSRVSGVSDAKELAQSLKPGPPGSARRSDSGASLGCLGFGVAKS